MKHTSQTMSRITRATHRIIGGIVLVISLTAFYPVLASEIYEDGYNAALASNYEMAFEKWKPLVSQNDGRAQFGLALMYHAGLFVDQNEILAIQLYKLAAENGIREAQEYLAAGYLYGWFDLPKNDDLAAYWLSKVEQ